MNRLLLVLAAVILAVSGCAGDPEPETTPTPQSTATATAESDPEDTETSGSEDEVTVEIEVKDGKVTPQGERVEVTAGQTIVLDVTSDVADEIHVHSDPEETLEMAAGDQKSLSFTLDTPGQYAVESHHLGVTIVQLVVRP